MIVALVQCSILLSDDNNNSNHSWMAHSVKECAKFLTWFTSFNPQITCCPNFTDQAQRD